MFWLAEVFNGRFSEDEIRRHEQAARQLRAEAVHHSTSAAGRELGRLLSGAVRGVRCAGSGAAALYRTYRRWQRRRTAIRELNDLSDYILQDIGLHRGDIRTAVDDMLDGKTEVRTAARVFKSKARQGIGVAGRHADQRKSADDWQRAA